MGIILVLILVITAIALFFSFNIKGMNQNKAFAYINNLKSVVLNLTQKTKIPYLNRNAINLDLLNSRINTTIHRDGNEMCDAFAVEICGTINTPSDRHKAVLKVNISDITDGLQKEQPVQAKVKQWQFSDSQNINVISELGTLPNKVTVLSEWTSVAKLRLDWILLPRIGKRKLKFRLSILSAETNRELASSECVYEHENHYFGYIDLQENLKRSKTLSVALAFSIISADGNLIDDEVEFVKNWARENINTYQTSDSDLEKLEDALNETVTFFKNGNVLNVFDICTEIVEILPASNRYDIIELCLTAVKISGSVPEQELKIIKDVVNWLELDKNKFRLMMEKIIPIDMHETMDIETLLGLTSDMTYEKARAHLNKEYAKWNSRVTNPDPQIQSQADQMLKLISEARTQYAKN